MKIETAWPLNGDEVSAAVIVKRHMQRLMNIADPMTEAFEEPELIAHVETESKIARVVQDSRDDTAIGDRAWTPGLNAFCRARQIDIMLGRSLTRKDVGPGASVGEGAETWGRSQSEHRHEL